MSELTVGSLSGLAANSYEIDIASGSTLDLANAKAASLPASALASAPGLLHISTQSFTGVSSVSFDNVFTADYANYRITIAGTNANSANVLLRWRAGGSDNSSSLYYTQHQRVRQNGTHDTTVQNPGDHFRISSQAAGVIPMQSVVDLIFPQAGYNAGAYGYGFSEVAGTYASQTFGGVFNATTSFDGFTISTSAGIFDGQISVYAYEEIA